MQKVRKGLEQKINLINKIQSNLRIKKVQLARPFEKLCIQLPLIDMNSSSNDNPQKYQKNFEDQINQRLAYLKLKGQNKKDYPFYSPQDSRSNLKQTKIIFASSTSRFNSKYSPSKVAQFRTIFDDKNYNAEHLRKTFFQKTNSIFSVNNRNSPKKINQDKQLTFYGKINQINHITGSKFKTLDNVTKSLEQTYKTRDQFETRIRKSIQIRLNGYSQQNQVKLPTMSQNSQNLQSIFQMAKPLHRRNKKKNNNKSQLINDRYSPWNNEGAEQLIWEQPSNRDLKK